MFHNRRAIAVRLLLAALISITGSGTPAIRHAHAEDNVQHAHRHTAKHSHRHRGHDHKALASSHDRHLHVALLGFQLTMPCLPHGNNSDDDCSPVLASLIQHPVASGGNTITNVLAVAEVPCDTFTAVVPIVTHFQCAPSIEHPLCDTARHERSGVQLS
jgi:hypothetical protein